MTWTNRYQHKMTLTMRAWPTSDRTHAASMSATEFAVTGMTYTHNCRMAVTHRYDSGKNHYYSWELSKEDGNRLCSIGSAGARIDRMRVKCPGTKFDTVKKECWLEVEVTVYPMADDKPVIGKGALLRGKEADFRPVVEAVWQKDWERNRKWVKRAFGYATRKYAAWLADWEGERRQFKGVYYVANRKMVDYPLFARKIMEGYVVVIDWKLHNNYQVQMKDIHAALDYWVEEGKEPDEPGGEFMGRCLGRSVFWGESVDVPDEVLAAGETAVEKYRREERLEKRRRGLRERFAEMVTVNVARYYGISQQLVTRRFIEAGYVEWIETLADKVANNFKEGVGYDYNCKGPACEAAKVLEFCIDAMAIRPPDPPPVVLSDKQREAKLEYARKKKDAFDKLPPEEQAKVLAREARRAAGSPQGMMKRIVEGYAAAQGRTDLDAVMAELTGEGVTDLVLNAIRTRGVRRTSGKITPCQAIQEAIVRVGIQAVEVMRRCKTGELVAGWNAERLVR